MAITNLDKLSEILNENTVNTRFDNWLFHHLLEYNRSRIANTITGSSDIRLAIAYEIERLRLSPEEIKRTREAQLIPDSSFNWFDDSVRFYIWLTEELQLNKSKHQSNSDENLLNLSPKSLCIALIDAHNASRNKKIDGLCKLKSDWEERVKIGNIFSWINTENHQQTIEIATKEIDKFRQLFKFKTSHSDHPFPRNQPTYKEQFLIELDSRKLTHQEAISASKSAKAKLSQINYRNKKDRGQVNVNISRTAIEKLNSLSNEFRLSKAKIIELLIEEEVINKKYITKKMAAWLNDEIP